MGGLPDRYHLDEINDSGPHQLQTLDEVRFELRNAAVLDVVGDPARRTPNVVQHRKSMRRSVTIGFFLVQSAIFADIQRKLSQREDGGVARLNFRLQCRMPGERLPFFDHEPAV